MFQSSEYVEQFFDKFHERNSHAVQGNPPKAATGRVAAVGHIHLIYMNINFKVNKLYCGENSCHAQPTEQNKLHYSDFLNTITNADTVQ
jgi:hypothetical protein